MPSTSSGGMNCGLLWKVFNNCFVANNVRLEGRGQNKNKFLTIKFKDDLLEACRDDMCNTVKAQVLQVHYLLVAESV